MLLASPSLFGMPEIPRLLISNNKHVVVVVGGNAGDSSPEAPPELYIGGRGGCGSADITVHFR